MTTTPSGPSMASARPHTRSFARRIRSFITPLSLAACITSFFAGIAIAAWAPEEIKPFKLEALSTIITTAAVLVALYAPHLQQKLTSKQATQAFAFNYMDAIEKANKASATLTEDRNPENGSEAPFIVDQSRDIIELGEMSVDLSKWPGGVDFDVAHTVLIAIQEAKNLSFRIKNIEQSTSYNIALSDAVTAFWTQANTTFPAINHALEHCQRSLNKSPYIRSTQI